MGGAVKAATGAVTGGLVGGGAGSAIGGILGGGKDFLFGKKDPGVASKHFYTDPLAKSRMYLANKGKGRLARSYIGEANRLRKSMKDEGKIARTMMAGQERNIRGLADQQKRTAQTEMAKRGLGKSSMGIRAALSADQRAGEKIAAIRSQAPMIKNQLATQRLGRMALVNQGLSNIYRDAKSTGIYQQGRASRGRTGGIGNVLLSGGGMALGGMMGGPQGAMMGGQLGTQLGGATRYM